MLLYLHSNWLCSFVFDTVVQLSLDLQPFQGIQQQVIQDSYAILHMYTPACQLLHGLCCSRKLQYAVCNLSAKTLPGPLGQNKPVNGKLVERTLVGV